MRAVAKEAHEASPEEEETILLKELQDFSGPNATL